MADQISNIVPEKLLSNLDNLITKFEDVEQLIDIVNGKAINIQVNLKGADNLSQLTEAIKAQQTTISQLGDVAKLETLAAKATAENAKAKMLLAKASVESAKAENLMAKALSETEKADLMAAKASTENSKAKLLSAKASAENAKQIEAETKLTLALNKEKERVQKLADKEIANLEKQKSAYFQLNEEYKKAAKAAQELGAQQAILAERIRNTSNPVLKGELQQQYQTLVPTLQNAQHEAIKLHNALYDIDKAVGKSQRNVGNYNGAVFAMSQVLREIPNFAYGARIGVMALSNNIPMLADEIGRLRAANDLLRESGQKTIPIWRTLMSAFTSPTGLITLAITAMTFLTSGIIKFGDEVEVATSKVDKLKDAVKSMNDVFADLNVNIATSTDIELNKSQRLIDVYRDGRTSLLGKINAYEELQGMYPKVLTALTDEEKKTMQLSAAHEKEFDKLNKVVALKNKIAEQDKIINADIKVLDQTKEQMSDIFKTLSPASIRQLNRVVASQKTGTHPTSNFPAEGVDNSEINKYLDLRDKTLKYEKAIAEWKKSQLQYSIDIANLENSPKVKDKKATAKGLESELALEKQKYIERTNLIQKEFDESRRTYTERQKMFEDDKKAASDHADAVISITSKWHGKVGEDENKFNARILQAQNDRDAILNASNEAELKMAKEIQDKHEMENEEIDKDVKKLQEQRQELEKLKIDLDELKKTHESSHAYAGGIGGVLEGLGFGNTGLTQSQKQHDIAIKAQQKRLDLATKIRDAEAGKGSGANPIELGNLTKNVASEELNLEKLKANKQAEIDESILEHKREIGRKTIELAQEIVAATKQISENEYQGKIKQLDIEQRNVELHAQQEIRAIDAKTEFAIQKDNEKALVAAQTAAKENELQQKRNNLELKKAIADKQMAEAQILMNTAVAEMKVIASAASLGPEGLAIGIAEAAIVAALGAAQYAAAASTPLPQFEEGGTTFTDKFIAAEGNKSELAVTPSGEVSLLTKEGVYNKPIGTQIFKHSDTVEMIEYARKNVLAGNTDLGIMQQIYNNDYILKEVSKIIGSKFENVGGDIVSAIYNARPRQDNSVADAMREMSNLQSKRK